MKKLCFLAAVLLIAALPVLASAEETVLSEPNTDDVISADGFMFDRNAGKIIAYTENAEVIAIPETIEGAEVTKIGSAAFCGKQAAEIFIPKTVTEIWEDNMQNYGTYPFMGMSALERIVVDEENPVFCSKDGVLFDRKGTLLWYPQARSDETYVLPADTTEIRTLAISETRNLKNLCIFNNNVSFGIWALGQSPEMTVYCRVDSDAAKISETLGGIAIKPGDADNSGTLTAADAAETLQKALISTYSLSGGKAIEVFCDVDLNGKIDAADSAEIMQRVLQSRYRMPIEK